MTLSNRCLVYSKRFIKSINYTGLILAILIGIFYIISFYCLCRFMYEQGYFEYMYEDVILNKGHKPTYQAPPEGIRGLDITALFTGLGAFFTLLAFYVQYVANRHQNKIHAKQSDSYSQEKSQAIFIQLMNLVKENGSNIALSPNISGKRAFHFMYYEFRAIHNILISNLHKKDQSIDDTTEAYQNLLAMSYSIFINGVFKTKSDKLMIDENSDKLMIDENKVIKGTAEKLHFDLSTIDATLEELLTIQQGHYDTASNEFFINQYGRYSNELLFFDGHRQDLSVVTKALIMVFDYIISDSTLNQNDFHYRMLGSQMSDHELFIYTLFFNYARRTDVNFQEDKMKNGFNVMLKSMDGFMLKKLLDPECKIILLDKDNNLI